MPADACRCASRRNAQGAASGFRNGFPSACLGIKPGVETKRTVTPYSLLAFPYSLMVLSYGGELCRVCRYSESSEVVALAQLLGLPAAEIEEIRAARALGLVLALKDVMLTPEQLLWFDDPKTKRKRNRRCG